MQQPRTLEEYEFRDFEEDVFVFSSLAYLIEIVKISATLLGLASLQPKDREGAISSAGTMLITWKLHLPREKQSVMKENGEVDHILFQAHILLQRYWNILRGNPNIIFLGTSFHTANPPQFAHRYPLAYFTPISDTWWV